MAGERNEGIYSLMDILEDKITLIGLFYIMVLLACKAFALYGPKLISVFNSDRGLLFTIFFSRNFNKKELKIKIKFLGI